VVVVVVDEGRQRFSKEESDDWVKYSTVTWLTCCRSLSFFLFFLFFFLS
jgi:hypothetical protein